MSSRESRVTGQLTDASRGSRVKKCDPLSSLLCVQHGCGHRALSSTWSTSRRRQVSGLGLGLGLDLHWP